MEKGNVRVQFMAAFSATLVHLTAGTFYGWASPVVPHLQGPNSELPLTSQQGSWVVALISAGHLLTPIPAGIVVDIVGRKPALAFTVLPFLSSWLLAIFGTSVATLYAARVVAGFGIGIGMTVGAIYLGEIAEDRIRGTIGTIFQVMVNLGVMFEFCIAPYVPYKTLNIISTIFPILFIVTFVWMPESPYFLLMKNRHSEAEKSLLHLRGMKNPHSVRAELDMMVLMVESHQKDKGALMDLVGSSGNRRALLISLGLCTIVTGSGHTAILAYSTEIFRASGSSLDAHVSVMVVGGIHIALSIVSSLLADVASRRFLLFTSCFGCALALFAEGLFFFLAVENNKGEVGWLPLAAIVFFFMSYTVGLGSIPMAIIGEVFPTNVKGLASSLLSMYFALMAFLVAMVFEAVVTQMGEHVIFWAFASICVLGMLFVIFCVPETKGKTILQINKELNYETIVKKPGKKNSS